MFHVSHFGVHNAEEGKPVAVNANAGDTLLFQATRDLLDCRLGVPIQWKLEALWRPIDQEEVARLNAHANLLLIGGGGLFLRDQAGADASASGWQWNCPVDRLRELTSPLVVFGVGYNRFRNQSEFDPVFVEHIRTVVQKSLFFGLRNSGSMRRIREYLPPELHDRVQYQPCPTTVAWYLYPQYQKGRLATSSRSRTLVLNAAFDREGMRFGDQKSQILDDIAQVMGEYVRYGWKLILANHKPQDAEMGDVLARNQVPFTSKNLASAYPEEVLEFYADKDLVVGMRGHAQMIPFGLRVPIVSVVSHDKMQWFLDDIQHPEWGADVQKPNFRQELERAMRHVSTSEEIRDQIRSAQERLWGVTTANLERIKAALRL